MRSRTSASVERRARAALRVTKARMPKARAWAHLTEKTRELICIAVAVTTRCDAGIGNHEKKAVKAGATREEISEARGVAVAMNAGAALAFSGRALDAYDEFSS